MLWNIFISRITRRVGGWGGCGSGGNGEVEGEEESYREKVKFKKFN